MTEKKQRGGKRLGAGRPSLFIKKKISIQLTSDELEVYERHGSPALFRFLIREYGGLCTHGIQELDLKTGAQTCSLCGADSPENFSKFFHQNRQQAMDDFPPVDINQNEDDY